MAGIILVSGALANKPHNGGNVWAVLSWVAGFRRLGFRVWFVEQIGRTACVDAAGAVTGFDRCANRHYFREAVGRFGLAGSAALVYEDGREVDGAGRADLLEAAGAADLLVNVSGHLTWGPIRGRCRRAVYLDLDPGFTQFWHADPSTDFRVGGHDFYYTIGENVGSPGCPVPTGGIEWRHVRQPVVLDDWPVTPADDPARFTTVASWRGAFGPVQFGGQTYGLKVHEFRKFLSLPGLVRDQGGNVPAFEVALDIHPGDAGDLESLRSHGWRVVDPKSAAAGPEAFRRYVQASGAEFSAAQGVYVHTDSGWFSDRTVRYLASGKPALVQETGFSRHLPAGEGLLAFRTPDEAAEGARRILRDYDAHAQAARAVAETYFDSDKVLARLLEEVGLG